MPEIDQLVPVKLVPMLGPLVFVVVWVLVLKALAVASGWERLAARFEMRGEFTGERLRFQSAVLNGVRFNNAFAVGVSPRGLYLAPFVLLRAFHKPLLIPWSEIRAAGMRRLWASGYRLTFRSVPGVRMDVTDALFERMAAHVKIEQEPARPGARPAGEADEETQDS